VTTHRFGERWTADVRLGDQEREIDVSLHRTFPTRDSATKAAEEILAEWTEERAILRELLLKELASAYRTMRQTHKTMRPPLVPATRASWESAIESWELNGWIDADKAAQYREHVGCAFEVEAARDAGRVEDVTPVEDGALEDGDA
jgi:hypothetical protein